MILRFCILLNFLTHFNVISGQDNSKCQKELFVDKDAKALPLKSPGYPWKYEQGTDCTWNITTQPGFKIIVDCPFVDITKENGKCDDKIILQNAKEGGPFCNAFRTESLGPKMSMRLAAAWYSEGKFSCSLSTGKLEPCDCGWTFKSKIVGGGETEINEFPMMVSLIDIVLQDHRCGATLITKKHVVTAAHCMMNVQPSKIGILVGEHDFTTLKETNVTRLYKVAKAIIHEKWKVDEKIVYNDIALLESEKEIQFNKYVGPACLPFKHTDLTRPKNIVTVVGWGTQGPGEKHQDRLHKVEINVVESSRCIDEYTYHNGSIQLCTFSQDKDACSMDSGGPLLYQHPVINRYFLVGIVSYGRQCAGPEPAVNTLVSGFTDWIKEKIQDPLFCIK